MRQSAIDAFGCQLCGLTEIGSNRHPQPQKQPQQQQQQQQQVQKPKDEQ
jgi:hypothetical protein